MGNFRKTTSIITGICFYFASTISQAALPPLSLSQMYNYASSGNVRALRAAVQRGMNIDVTDRNGDTALCYAIKKNNRTAYNALRAAGANPRHGCTVDMPRQQYESFMNSYGVAGVNETPRAAYNQFNDGEFIISKKTWIIGGLLLVAGAGAALAFSGGGGGGGKSKGYTATNDSLGDFAGQKIPDSAPGGYQPIIKKAQNGDSVNNTETMNLNNDNTILYSGPSLEEGGTGEVTDQPTHLTDLIDFHKKMLGYAKYIQVAMKAYENSTVTNNATINLNDVTAGLVALGENAYALNNSLIQINAQNGSIGMIASDKGQASNSEEILIGFEGNKTNHQVVGMYADTGSSISNHNTIATVSSNASAGTLVGMQGRIINQEKNPSQGNATNLINSAGAVIDLSNTSSGDTNGANIVGMGSYIDDDFLNGRKLLSRAGFVNINNGGTINLKSTLIGTSTYTSNIRENTGGIIGIRSDANTKATNQTNGKIIVEVEANNQDSFVGAHAGMLSVHGGTIINDGLIDIKGGTSGYGMIAIRGEGTNSEFDTRKPILTNTGNINIDSTDGFGMISFHGGNLTNSGQITFNSTGTGIHTNAGTVNNTGTIDINEGGKGITVIANEAGEGSTNYDTTNTKVTNAGTININKANDKSYGIYIEYGTLNNNGTVKLENIDSSISGTTYGLYAFNGIVNNTGNVNININNTSETGQSYGIYTDNANINNQSTGTITFSHKGVGIYSENGKVVNNGSVVMNGGGVGVASKTGNITNKGTVTLNTGSGIGISTSTGTVENTNKVIVNADNSVGISASAASGEGEDEGGSKSTGIIYNGTATDNAAAEITMTGKNVVGIFVDGDGKVYNYGKININSDVDGVANAGIMVSGNTTVDNFGAITLKGNAAYINGNEAIGINAEKGTVNNRAAINISGFYGYGIITESGIVNNLSKIELTNAGYGIMGGIGSSTVNASGGEISIEGNDVDDVSYGMHTTGGTARNDGIININDEESFGIFAGKGTGTGESASEVGGQGVNNKTINVMKDSSVGLGVSGSESIITNSATGEVNVSGKDAYGMMVASGKAYNMGTINLTGLGGMGVFVQTGSATNTGSIKYTNTSNSDVYGMIAAYDENSSDQDVDQYAMIINGKTGIIELNGGIGMQAAGSKGSATNNGTITIKTGTDIFSNSGMQAMDQATVTNSSTGKITTSGVGMIALGEGSKAINNGNISSETTGAYGMYAIGGATITNNGNITLSNATGMLAEGENSKAINNGNIYIDGSIGIGMAAIGGGSIYNAGTISLGGIDATGIMNGGMVAEGIKGSDPDGADDIISKIYNTGKIIINSSVCNSGNCGTPFIQLGEASEFVNGAMTLSASAINFNEWTENGGKILLGSGGTFDAPELSGEIYADSSIVKGSFEKIYTNENSFIGNDEGIELASYSYMFDAYLSENEDGNQDVIMEMKDFDEVVSDKSMSDYLSNAYDALGEEETDAVSQNANNLFDALKSANNQNKFDRTLNNQLGLDFFPSLAHQNLEVIKSLNRQVNNSLFTNDNPREVIVMMGYDFVTKDQERSGAVDGYEEDAHSVYGLIEKKHNNNFSYGAGITLTKLDSKYNNGSKRDDTLIHVLAPLKYKGDSFTFVSIPRVGYGWGDYDRHVSGSVYSADTKNLYYGITNEVRKDIDLRYFTLEPTAEFNILGVYQDKTKEREQLTIKSSNNISIEGGLGLYAKKSININEDNAFKVRLGATFYQELGDYDNTKASMSGVLGSYNMKGYESDRSRGVMSGRLDYIHKEINLFTEASKTIERDGAYDIRAGIEFRF